MGLILPNWSQPMWPKKSGAMSFVAPRRPMKVAIMNQKAEVRQKPMAVRSVRGMFCLRFVKI
jgi:hypothetical protein